MKLRSLLTLALAATMLVAAPITAKADDDDLGWEKKSKGYKYEYEDGKYYKDTVEWLLDKDGEEYNYYYFDEKGYLQTGGWITDILTYEDEDGKDIPYDVAQYYADKTGALQCNEWETIDGQRYYFDWECNRVEDRTYGISKWNEDKEEWVTKYYHFAPTGELTKGWYWHDSATNDSKDGWYYSNSKGVVEQGFETVDGYKYLFLGDETMSATAYFGKMATGSVATWEEVEKEREDGSEYTTWEVDDYYYFTPTGTMVTGWYQINGNDETPAYVCMGADGKADEGWVASGGNYYYIDERGFMKRDAYIEEWDYDYDENGFIVDSELESRYYVGHDGAMITGWYDNSWVDANATSTNAWMYANADGSIEAQWIYNGGGWYFIDEYGDMVKDGYHECITKNDEMPAEYQLTALYPGAAEAWVNAHTYVFDATGRMVEGGWYSSYDSFYGVTYWYHAEANGLASQGWVVDNGNYYYCIDGYMMTNYVTEDGYYVGYDGVWR